MLIVDNQILKNLSLMITFSNKSIKRVNINYFEPLTLPLDYCCCSYLHVLLLTNKDAGSRNICLGDLEKKNFKKITNVFNN